MYSYINMSGKYKWENEKFCINTTLYSQSAFRAYKMHAIIFINILIKLKKLLGNEQTEVSFHF